MTKHRTMVSRQGAAAGTARRRVLGAGLLGGATVAWPALARGAPAGRAELVSLRAPTALARLSLDSDGGLLGVSPSGELWRLEGGSWRSLGRGLDASSPIATGHGRVAGRSLDGGLWLLESGRVTQYAHPVLAPHAGLLVLALAVIAVAAGRDGRHHVVRLEPGARGWEASARSKVAVLPDARPVQFDASGTGNDDNGHVAVFGGPDPDRYRHGVLGDSIEGTSVLVLERHGLEPLAGLELPAPWVFEDIAPRPIAWRAGRALLTVRAGPQGAQLAVVAPAAGRPDRLELAALGPPLGTANRWMSPTTDGAQLWAVHTPHIGGVLHRYQVDGDRLTGTPVARDVSNHRIGQRDLDTSAWSAGHWMVPSQDGLRLRIFELAAGTAVAAAPREVALGSPAIAMQRWSRDGRPGAAVLLQGGSVVWAGTAN
jgi:hypothetical protein